MIAYYSLYQGGGQTQEYVVTKIGTTNSYGKVILEKWVVTFIFII